MEKKGFYKKCENCGNEFYVKNSREKIAKMKNSRSKFCSLQCRRKNQQIPFGDGYITYDGYKADGSGRKEHIVLMEKYIGRKLHKNEVVHHINHNKIDNRIENLQLMTRAEHNKLHFSGRGLKGRCIARGMEYKKVHQRITKLGWSEERAMNTP